MLSGLTFLLRYMARCSCAQNTATDGCSTFVQRFVTLPAHFTTFDHFLEITVFAGFQPETCVVPSQHVGHCEFNCGPGILGSETPKFYDMGLNPDTPALKASTQPLIYAGNG